MIKIIKISVIRKFISIINICSISLLLVGCNTTNDDYVNKYCVKHEIIYELVSPTCQCPGYERYKCINCSYEEIKNQTPPKQCFSLEEIVTKIDDCTTKHIQKCIWCDKIIREYSAKNHFFKSMQDEGGDQYSQCIYCDYKYYSDSGFTKIPLKITTPVPINYYNKVKLKQDGLYLTLKFLNIETDTATAYYLQDIIFKFENEIMHWNEESTVFEFNCRRTNWFETTVGVVGYNQGLELSQIKLGSEFKDLRWSNLYPKISDVKEIEMIFIESLK